MFNYGNANEAQKEAISATDGLVLITAGPGTGKTFTLVKRAVYLIQECGIQPEQIMMATFTEKAAKELITRITNERQNEENTWLISLTWSLRKNHRTEASCIFGMKTS